MHDYTLDAPKNCQLYFSNDVLVCQTDSELRLFKKARQVAVKGVQISTISQLVKTERELILLSKYEGQSTLSKLQGEYRLEPLSEARVVGEINNIWQVSATQILISDDRSSQLLDIIVHEESKIFLKSTSIQNECTLAYQNQIQVTETKIRTPRQQLDSLQSMAAIGLSTLTVLQDHPHQQLSQYTHDLQLVCQLPQLTGEVQCFGYVEQSDYLLVSRWNSNRLTVYLHSSVVCEIDVAEYAPYSVLEIESFQACTLQSQHYLFVSLRSGVCLVLGLYPQMFERGGAPCILLAAKQCQLSHLQKVHDNCVVMLCEDRCILVSQKARGKLLMHQMNRQLRVMCLVSNLVICAFENKLQICHLDGPQFGKQFKHQQVQLASKCHHLIHSEHVIFLTSPAELTMICATTFKTIQSIPFEQEFIPSAMVMLADHLFVGLTHLSETSSTQPESGNIIKYHFDGAELTRVGQCEAFGAILSLATDNEYIFAGINSKLVCFTQDLDRVAESESQILVYKVKCERNEVLVCDVMKSLTVYTFSNRQFRLLSKYPNGQWCFEALKLGSGYLHSDFNKNLAFLASQTELLEIKAQHSLKEQVNSSVISSFTQAAQS